MYSVPLSNISALVPVFNGEKYLERCLRSLLAQDIVLHEIVIVDNNSTDKTKEIIISFQQKFSQIKYIFEEIRYSATSLLAENCWDVASKVWSL